VHTHFIDENLDTLRPQHEKITIALTAAALGSTGAKTKVMADVETSSSSPWTEIGRWEICSQ
jgi:hypothetical protein